MGACEPFRRVPARAPENLRKVIGIEREVSKSEDLPTGRQVFTHPLAFQSILTYIGGFIS